MTAARFKIKGETTDRYRDLLDSLVVRFQTQPLLQQSYGAAIMHPFLYADTPLPMRHITSTLWDSLNRQPQAPFDSDQANPEKDAQPLETPEDKE